MTALQPRQEKPAGGGDGFYILQSQRPTIRKNILQCKVSLLCRLEHILKVFVFGLSLLRLVINPKVEGDEGFPLP